MEARGAAQGAGGRRATTGRLPAWLLGLIPLVLIGAAVAAFALLGGPGLGDRKGPPVEELAVERTVLQPGQHRADRPQRRPGRGHDRQVIVNDGFADFSVDERTSGTWRRRRSR